jgi:hypothetical protein
MTSFVCGLALFPVVVFQAGAAFKGKISEHLLPGFI